MKRDFLAEFKSRIRAIDRAFKAPSPDLTYYNIHKRSLPVGIDKIVMFNVLKTEGEYWIETKFKAKCYQDFNKDSKTIIYYDLVPVGAAPKEKNVYFNNGDVLIK